MSIEEIATAKPEFEPPRVNQATFKENTGPWNTKSDGLLNVHVRDGPDVIDDFMIYEPSELQRLSSDIRGFRIYTVRGMPKGALGGTEFHRIRDEKLICIEGSMRWTLEDVYGDKVAFDFKPGDSAYFPPFIMHTYDIFEDGSGFLICCNTDFNPDDPLTHDTYIKEHWDALVKNYR